MNEFDIEIEKHLKNGLTAKDISTLQVNVGLSCNQKCEHCHLRCSPNRPEVMSWQVMESICGIGEVLKPELVDITGGAPELNPYLKRFIAALTKRNIKVQVRTNLTVMLEPGIEDYPEFFKKHKVHLVASLPCYLKENVCAQRGEGVYEGSVKILKRLNGAGYGVDPELPLNLVYNPGGPFLPGLQSDLEAVYKKELKSRFGIQFNSLLTITNIPIGKFLTKLKKLDQLNTYLQLLKKSFNPSTLDSLMCRHQLEIGWDGTIYDCDFNLGLGLSVNHGAPDRLESFDQKALTTRRIVTGFHCFGCTAGQGSSCSGALS